MKLWLYILLLISFSGSLHCQNTLYSQLEYCLPHDRHRNCAPSSPLVMAFTTNMEPYFFPNKCRACSNYLVRSVLPVEQCPPKNSSVRCTLQPVCAIAPDNSLKQYKSDCGACTDEGIKYIFRSKCPKSSK